MTKISLMLKHGQLEETRSWLKRRLTQIDDHLFLADEAQPHDHWLAVYAKEFMPIGPYETLSVSLLQQEE